MGNSTKITPKQQRFVDEYLIDLNATQAYIRAGYKASEVVAGIEGHKLLKNPKVDAYLQKRMRDREKRTEISQDRVLKELAKIGFADIKDFLAFRTEKTVISHEDGEPVIDYQQIVEMKPSDLVDGTLINEISIGKDGTLKFKLHDKMSALEKMGKHLKMFTDKQEVQVSGETTVNNNNIDFSHLSVEEIKKLLEG